MLKKVLLSLVMCGLIAAPALSADMESKARQGDYEACKKLAYSYYKSGDQVSAFAWQKLLVNSGHAKVTVLDFEQWKLYSKMTAENSQKAEAYGQELVDEIWTVPPKTPGYGAPVYSVSDLQVPKQALLVLDHDENGKTVSRPQAAEEKAATEAKSKAAQGILALEQKAFAGNVKAMRDLAAQLAGQEAFDAYVQNKDEHQCAWRQVVFEKTEAKADELAMNKACDKLTGDSVYVAKMRSQRLFNEIFDRE